MACISKCICCPGFSERHTAERVWEVKEWIGAWVDDTAAGGVEKSCQMSMGDVRKAGPSVVCLVGVIELHYLFCSPLESYLLPPYMFTCGAR